MEELGRVALVMATIRAREVCGTDVELLRRCGRSAVTRE